MVGDCLDPDHPNVDHPQDIYILMDSSTPYQEPPVSGATPTHHQALPHVTGAMLSLCG